MASVQDDNDPEGFLNGDSLVSNLMQLIEDIGNSAQPQEAGKKPEKGKKGFLPPDIDEDTFIVHKPPDRRYFGDETNKSKKSSVKSSFAGSLASLKCKLTDQFTFVNQIDCDAELRANVRAERQRIANNFRIMGNYEYRQLRYKEAMLYYNKGLTAVYDTPVLHCNRGLCQAKLGRYEYALLDFDLVISKIDPGCLQAWLCRGACYQRLGKEAKFLEAITMANHHNPEKKADIDEFLIKLKAGNF